MPWVAADIPELTDADWTEWALAAKFRESAFLFPIRDKVLDHAALSSGDVVLDVGTGDGLIAFAALERVGPAGRVIFSDIAQGLIDHCHAAAERLGVLGRSTFLRASADDLSAVPDESVDAVTARSVLHCLTTDAKRQALCEFHRVLRPGGRFSGYDPINRFGAAVPEPTHLLRGYDVTPVQDLAERVRGFVAQERPLEANTSLSFDERDLFAYTTDAGFQRVEIEYHARVNPSPPARQIQWDAWVSARQGPGAGELSVGDAIDGALAPAERERFVAHLRPLVEAGARAPMTSRFAETYLWATR